MVQQVREVMTEDPVVVSSLTSVVNVAQLMRRKDMGAVLVADDRLRGLVADRERLVHQARYRFSPGRHQRCQAKRVHDDLGVACPLDPGKKMVNYDLLASNGVSRHDLADTALGRVRGRSTVTGDLTVAYHHRDRLREAIRRTDPAETTKRKWQL
ncbi:CBS domain-containing protein [Streptomyces sp. NBC_01744]|uniref:CBS domain-containing protein n=1 Tax=Streptomyces sp. NBC_01744 TaxID=2975927 RepID=UPI003D9A5865|nr:CBS domain-containing protein [Streptomyces sp. NBC_01744]